MHSDWFLLSYVGCAVLELTLFWGPDKQVSPRHTRSSSKRLAVVWWLLRGAGAAERGLGLLCQVVGNPPVVKPSQAMLFVQSYLSWQHELA